MFFEDCLKFFLRFKDVCNLFSIVSTSKGSDAANRIASTCLSSFVGELGNQL